jgi:hypothetical protein
MEVNRRSIENRAHEYLMKEHVSILNNILHAGNIKLEMQYHKDIEKAFAAGAEWKDGQLKDCLDLIIQTVDHEYLRTDGTYGNLSYVVSDQIKYLKSLREKL